MPAKVKATMAERAKKGLEEKEPEEIADELRSARGRRLAAERAAGPRNCFGRWVRALVVDNMKNSIQAMF